VADILGVPAVTFGGKLTLEGDSVTISRDGDTATLEVQASLPAVVSVTDQTDDARYPSFKGIMAAKKKEVDEWSLADLGLDGGSVGLDAAWTKVESNEPRPPRTAGEIVTDEGDGGVKLVEFLASKKFV
jgi:electron transfer flavoprotein beta subunit